MSFKCGRSSCSQEPYLRKACAGVRRAGEGCVRSAPGKQRPRRRRLQDHVTAERAGAPFRGESCPPTPTPQPLQFPSSPGKCIPRWDVFLFVIHHQNSLLYLFYSETNHFRITVSKILVKQERRCLISQVTKLNWSGLQFFFLATSLNSFFHYSCIRGISLRLWWFFF